MVKFSPSAQVTSTSKQSASLIELVRPFFAPYYLAIAAVLGAITVGFAIVVVLLVMVAANFNVLGLVE